ncbi:MAG: phosphoribosyltransferase family protein [Bacteroidetes bacterium]|nr:phosphoribosyltransferase family protein [Bacteroidota bacterium]
MESVILNTHQLEQKIQRIAYQLFEEHQDEETLIFAGVNGNGFLFAKEINTFFQTICPIKTTVLEVIVDKSNPFKQAISCNDQGIENTALILIDDVLNSGSTLIAAVHYFLKKPMKKIKTVVLIDRNHRTFPIAADFVGMSLATTLQEHVEVRSENGILKEVILK